MSLRIAWGISGSGDFLPETIEVMKNLVKKGDVKVTIFLSRAAVGVVDWYGLRHELESISPKILVEEGPNSPFIAGALQIGRYDFLVISPATANTVAKIVVGIADSLVTNSVSQAQKGNIPTYIVPVDQTRGRVTTILPTGEKLELTMRDVDVQNVEKLRSMKGITVLKHPREILNLLAQRGRSPIELAGGQPRSNIQRKILDSAARKFSCLALM